MKLILTRPRYQLVWGVISLLAALLVNVFMTTPAYAGGVVGTGTPASCTEAAFDAALAGGGAVTFSCGGPKTITFTFYKQIADNTTIDGGGVITLSSSTYMFQVFFAKALTLTNITLANGSSNVTGAVENFGTTTIINSQLVNNRSSNTGGAIVNYGTLNLTNSTLSNNRAANGGGGIYNDGGSVNVNSTLFAGNVVTGTIGGGGGINNNSGSITVQSSTFTNNRSLDGGAVYVNTGTSAVISASTIISNSAGYGGGLENSGTVTLTNSLLNLNTVTGSGGGIWNLGGTVTLQQTTVSNNIAYEGGGINSYGSHLQITDANIVGNIATGTHGGGIYHGGGTAFITNATISGNQANGASANGGGIYQNSNDNLTLTNVTVTNNQAGFFGGGLYHFGRYAILTNVTIGNNQAGPAGDAIYEDSPMTPANPGVIQMANSVIFGSANNCDGPAFQSLGHNISKGTCVALSAPSDQNNYAGNLNLGGLSFNGGAFPMQTILPLAGSPLINAGDAGQCGATDQRGAPRVDTCDIGAVEYGAVAPGPSSGVVYLPVMIKNSP